MGAGRGQKPPNHLSNRGDCSWQQRQGYDTRPSTAALPLPHRGMAADDDSIGSQKRQSDGADGASPENGTHPRRKYRLLAPEELEEPEGGRANAGPRAPGDGHGATRGTVE